MADQTSAQIYAQIIGVASKAVRVFTLEITTALVRTTPVDTGHARANWIPSIGAPAEFVAGAPGTADGTLQAAGIVALAGYSVERGPAFVTNNVSYVPRLNEGSSAQAPAGFIEQAIDAGVAEAKRKLAKIGGSR